MRKRLYILIIFIAVCVSCSIPYEHPYGVWYNEKLGLTLDITPVESGPYFGTYQKNDEIVKIFIKFAQERAFVIYDYDCYDFVEDKWLTTADNSYFNGYFKMVNGRIHYTLKPHWKEQTGIRDVIIFEKVD